MIDLQIASSIPTLPTEKDLSLWVAVATKSISELVLVTVRIVDDAESQALNSTYRGKDQPTNVLSFVADWQDIPEAARQEALDTDTGTGTGQIYLGDLVLNAALIEREAAAQNKPIMHHWAHLLVHGCLHLQGYDHIEEQQALVMEALEVSLLAQLGIASPYVNA